MRTGVVEFTVEAGDDGQDGSTIRLVVAEATAMHSMRRAVLQGRGEAWRALNRPSTPSDNGDDPGTDDPGTDDPVVDVPVVDSLSLLNFLAGTLAARIIYPDLVACTVDADGLDVDNLSVDQFLALPERLVGEWEAEVYRLNPHWLPPSGDETPEEAQAEKKD